MTSFRILLVVLLLIMLAGIVIIAMLISNQAAEKNSAQETAKSIYLTNTFFVPDWLQVTSTAKPWTKTPDFTATANAIYQTNTFVQRLINGTATCKCWTSTRSPTPPYTLTALMATHQYDNTRAYGTATALAPTWFVP